MSHNDLTVWTVLTTNIAHFAKLLAVDGASSEHQNVRRTRTASVTDETAFTVSLGVRVVSKIRFCHWSIVSQSGPESRIRRKASDNLPSTPLEESLLHVFLNQITQHTSYPFSSRKLLHYLCTLPCDIRLAASSCRRYSVHMKFIHEVAWRDLWRRSSFFVCHVEQIWLFSLCYPNWLHCDNVFCFEIYGDNY